MTTLGNSDVGARSDIAGRAALYPTSIFRSGRLLFSKKGSAAYHLDSRLRIPYCAAVILDTKSFNVTVWFTGGHNGIFYASGNSNSFVSLKP
jgi:hypothetical protein